MPIFSAIIVLYVLYCFFMKSATNAYYSLLTISIFIELIYPQGNFLGNKTGIGLGYRNVSLIIIFIGSLLYLTRNKFFVNKKILYSSAFFIGVVLIGIILSYIMPYDGYIIHTPEGWDLFLSGRNSMIKADIPLASNIKNIVLLGLFIFNVTIFKSLIDKEKLTQILDKIVKYLYFIILYGVIEFLIKYVFRMPDLMISLNSALFGVAENTVTYSLTRGDMLGLQGVTSEPSHYVGSLFLIIVLFSICDKIHPRKKYNLLIFISFIFMVLSGSFSSILYLIVALYYCFYLYYGQYKNKWAKLCKNILIDTLVFFMLLFSLYMVLNITNSYYLERLENALVVINSIADSNLVGNIGTGESSWGRLLSLYYGFNIFYQNPLFGIGLEYQSVYDLTINILCNTGILGLISYFMVISSGYKEKTDRFAIFLLVIIGGVFNSFVAKPYEVIIVVLSAFTMLYCNNDKRNIYD